MVAELGVEVDLGSSASLVEVKMVQLMFHSGSVFLVGMIF